jgi:hypothetical protein
MSVTCPKCGFEQDSGPECRRCGIIMARYKPPPAPAQQPRQATDSPTLQVSSSGFFQQFVREFVRAARWVIPVVAILVLISILRQAPPPQIKTDPTAAQRIETKMEDLQAAAAAGQPYTLQMNEAELNSWLTRSLALAPQGLAGGAPTSIEEAQSTMRDIKIELLSDSLRAYVIFDFHGKNLSLLLEGRLFVQNGYLRFAPMSGKLGSLPIPQFTLDRAVSGLFDSPANKEKFLLPTEIRDVRIEDSEVVVFYR